MLPLQRSLCRSVTHTLILSSVIYCRHREEHEHEQLTGHRRIDPRAVIRCIHLAENKAGKDPPNPTERYEYRRRNSPFGMRNNVVGGLLPQLAILDSLLLRCDSDQALTYARIPGMQPAEPASARKMPAGG